MRSLRENISLPNLKSHQRGLLLNKKREKEECSQYAKEMTVKSAGLEIEALSLSGGNQQKVVLAKWLMANPKVLILDEPTRGVDVGAKAEIHTQICKLAARGIAIIMISSELPEIMGMSDRILVYHEGKLNGEILRRDILSGVVDAGDNPGERIWTIRGEVEDMNSLGKRANRLGMDQTDLSLLMRRYGIGLVLIAMCIFLMIATPNFTKATNLLFYFKLRCGQRLYRIWHVCGHHRRRHRFIGGLHAGAGFGDDRQNAGRHRQQPDRLYRLYCCLYFFWADQRPAACQV